jgi:hypothetical protein
MLIHLARGRLPWLYVDVRQGNNYINIFNCKRTISAKELVGSLPVGFVALVDYARNMRIDDMPDYDYIRRILSEIDSKNFRNIPIGRPNNLNMDRDEKKSHFIKSKSTAPTNKSSNHLTPNVPGLRFLPRSGESGIGNSGAGSESKTFGKYLKVCTNSMSVMNDSQINSRFK